MIPKPLNKPVLVITFALAVAIFFPPRTTRACGPFFAEAIFVFSTHPDFPLDNYAAGKLGIVRESWARSYLVVAYRTLAANPLSQSEAKAIQSLWDDRLYNRFDLGETEWVRKWNEARKAAGATTPVEISVYRFRDKPHDYETFLNCQQDAFVNAENLLKERIKLFGADSVAVRSWLAAQDAVFANCNEGAHLPKDAASEAPDLPPLVRADRAYQIAAANFYATNLEQAQQQFDEIARDKNSPHHLLAPYMSARSMLRKGSFAEKDEERRRWFNDAENRLKAILRDDSLKSQHGPAERLLALVRLRLYPENKLHELAQTIANKDAATDFKQAVWDYTVLLDKYLEVEDEAAKRNLPTGLNTDDLTDWILTLEGDLNNSAAHAVERWTRTKSLPWLVAALASASGKDANVNELLAAAKGVNSSSPAFPSLVFHSVRLLTEANRVNEARAVLDQVLANERQHLNASSLNSFLGQRMIFARGLEEFLKNAPRKPAAFSVNDDGREIPEDENKEKPPEPLFDFDAANIFNQAMTVALMKEAAKAGTLPANLRRDVAQAAFVRAALLDERQTAIEAALPLQEELPEVKEFLTAYQRAATPEARRFAAAFLTLKFPGLRPFVSAGTARATAVDDIDSYRDNYWCTTPPQTQTSSDSSSTSKVVAVPDFLKSSQGLAARQYATLQSLGTAPNYFCRIAIEWAQKNATDPRAPEALHLAVRSTRYGCTDNDTGRWSKAAFDLLHSRYPNTTWAKNTKYWFK